jgi:hypothetical protein
MDLLHIGRFVRLVGGYFIFVFAGHVIVAWAVNFFWRIADATKDSTPQIRFWHGVTELWRADAPKDSLRPDPRIRSWHGVAERFLYTSTILLGKPQGIAVWLAFNTKLPSLLLTGRNTNCRSPMD